MGTAMLLAAVVGSGIMAERLAGGNARSRCSRTARDGRGARRADPHLRSDLRRALQSRRHDRGASRAGSPGATCLVMSSLRSSARFARRLGGARDVRGAARSCCRAMSAAAPRSAQRVRRDVRAARRDLGMFAPPRRGRAVRGRGLHHRRVLVHGVDVVRQSRGDAGARADGHIRRHSTARRARLHRGAVRRRGRWRPCSSGGSSSCHAEVVMNDRPVCLRSQRRSLADGGGLVQPAGGSGAGAGDLRGHRSRAARAPRGGQRHAGSGGRSRQRGSTRLTPELAQQAQVLVTMGCGDECPVVPGLRRDDWPLDDPKGQPIERVRAIRDEIRQRVEVLLDREGWSRPR